MATQSTHSLFRSLALIVALVVALAVGAFYLFGANQQSRNVTVSDAVALPMSGTVPGLMVTLTLSNSGKPVVFTDILSTDAGNTHIMGGDIGRVVVPGNGSVSFALDGAHIMMMAVSGELQSGRLIPLHFTLGDGSVLKTQVTIGEADPMDHSMHAGMQGLSIDPAPQVTLQTRRDDTTDNWYVTADVPGFEFDTERVDVEHVPGAGHGHLYLNGAKLGRYYGGDMSIGQLPPGTHSLRLDLNTNLHQPYVSEGAALTGETWLIID